ncbi:adenylyltransferase and sulfurtransferase [Pedobacter westerhofensis]|uniref:Molybdopterin-synthase adenylyltransferase n=1 Tax=Pedobacter westerhofensis TaxID=425512 RepID=A0A521CCH6_9SPHI|nr:HesA/MoeB/ThiF family protein [Pedobacter westerhofensis]SMO56470.1 adenylyltransferase and sulfurtransferase [Pedobacter westerhofensis]
MEIKGKARYARQMILKGFGPAGQQKLFQAKVLVIGAGGLGCPILQYLAAAGVGTLGIVDDDTVELSNLHRQILYSVADVGRLKADCAAEKLSLYNPDIQIISYPLQLSNQNAALIMSKFDIVIDGSDNFPTRYMVNDACALLNLPLVYGALSESEGQVAVFNVSDAAGRKVNYRDIFPNPPQPGEVLNCAEAGVLGVLPGIIGTMQASEAIKLISGVGEPLINQMLIYNLYTNHTYKINLTSADTAESILPPDLDAFLETDYNWFCGIRDNASEIQELSAGEFRELMLDEEYEIIDVRELAELPLAPFDHIRVPLSEIRKKVPALEKEKIILFCHSGVRSVIAGGLLQEVYPEKEFFSLKGGILRLN